MSSTSDLPDDLVERAGQLLSFLPPTSWCAEVRSELEQVLDETQKIGVACSGGADSISALLLIFAAYPKLRKRIWVLHFNHRLRKEASDLDESFVRSIASKLNLAFITERSQRSQKLDEGSLRDQRLRFFEKITRTEGLKFIIQGHHLNDLTESLLWRISRGVSVDGLISPSPVSQVGTIRFLRPLLSVTKASILDGMRKCNIPWREDASNKGHDYLRNRLRHSVLPEWEGACDRDLLLGVQKTVQKLREESIALQYHAKQVFKICLEADNSLNLAKLQPYPNATKIRVLRLWLELFNKEEKTLTEKAQLLLDKILEGDCLKLQISNHTYVREFKDLLFLEKPQKNNNIPHCLVPLLGKLYLKGQSSSSALRNKILNKEVDPDLEAYISPEIASEGIFMRSRDKGDLFQPLGSSGKKKLADRMIDKKWSERKKSDTPIFLNHNGEILWVPGFPPSDFTKVSALNDWVIHLTYQQLPTECFRG
ncbi:MAG: tRNA lysidine(34) synthetase TilS [Opitutales bacterium]